MNLCKKILIAVRKNENATLILLAFTNWNILNRKLTFAHIELIPKDFRDQRVLALMWSKALLAF